MQNLRRPPIADTVGQNPSPIGLPTLACGLRYRTLRRNMLCVHFVRLHVGSQRAKEKLMWRFLLLAQMLFITVSTHAELRVVYPNEEGAAGQNYGAQVLALALAKSGIPYTLTIHPARVNQERARVMIEEGT